MSTLLHMDASVQHNSTSRELSARFAKRWAAAHRDSNVVHRDLAEDPLPHITRTQAEFLMYGTRQGEDKPGEVLRCEQLVEELRSADLLLMGIPMYNFTVPSTVKAWIDHIAWPGYTFDPIAGKGLVNTSAVVILTRGGSYMPDSPRADFNFHETYLRKVFEFIGITDVEFIPAELRLFVGENSPDEKLRDLGEQSYVDAVDRIDELTPTE